MFESRRLVPAQRLGGERVALILTFSNNSSRVRGLVEGLRRVAGEVCTLRVDTAADGDGGVDWDSRTNSGNIKKGAPKSAPEDPNCRPSGYHSRCARWEKDELSRASGRSEASPSPAYRLAKKTIGMPTKNQCSMNSKMALRRDGVCRGTSDRGITTKCMKR